MRKRLQVRVTSWFRSAFRGKPKNESRHDEGLAPIPGLPEGAGYTATEIATAVCLVMSDEVTRRIAEDVWTRGTTLLRETTTDFVLHSNVRAPGDRLIVPLGTGARGVLWDTEYAACEGRPISILVNAENALIARAILGAAWRRAFDSLIEPSATLRSVLLSLPVISKENAAQDFDEVRETLRALASAHPDRATRIDELSAIAAFFTCNYIVFAEVPEDVGRRFMVSRRLSTPYKVRRLGPLRYWRRSAGLRPVTLTIPLYGSPFRAMSYHLRVKAPEGYHIHVRELLGVTKGQPEWSLESQDSARTLWSKEGGDIAHLYIAHGASTEHRENQRALVAKVKFAEDLPTSLVSAVSAAAVLMALLTLSLAFYPHVFPDTEPAVGHAGLDQANSSFAALLAAVPGIASLWFRPRHVDELVRLPLTSLVAPVATGLLSFAVAVTFIGFRLSPCRRNAMGAIVGCNPDRRAITWATLTAVSAIWTLFLAHRVIAKHTSEEPCRPRWPQRSMRRRRRANARVSPFPIRPPGWIRDLWTGKVEVSKVPAVPTLDNLYEALKPPSRRGDIYMIRAESFEFPFTCSLWSTVRHREVVHIINGMLMNKELGFEGERG